MMNMGKWCLAVLATCGLLVATGETESSARTKTTAPAKKDAKSTAAVVPPVEAEPDTKPEDVFAGVKHTKGPSLIALGDGLELDLPAGFVLLDPSVLSPDKIKSGNSVVGYKGTVVSMNEAEQWALDIQYDDKGYVSDSDAADLNASELFQSYVQGTNAANAQRRANGIDELFVDGWQTEPHYNAVKHHLQWGLNAHTKDGKLVNIITNALGRRGLVELTLIEEADKAAAAQTSSAPVAAGLRFVAGSRYEEFDKSSDKSSGLGLKALVVGGVGLAVAKKTGLLVVLLLAMKKGAVLIFAPIFLFFKKIFGRKSNDSNV
jgi:uncharacterized membrane-anchored protein